MTSRARTYGRRKGQDLAAFFNNLSLDSPKKDTTQAAVDLPKDSVNKKANEDVEVKEVVEVQAKKARSALAPKSANATKRHPDVSGKAEDKAQTEIPQISRPRTLTKERTKSELWLEQITSCDYCILRY